MKKALFTSMLSIAFLIMNNHYTDASQFYTTNEDTPLSELARTFATTTHDIRALNKIAPRTDSVRAHTRIVVPDRDIIEVQAGDNLHTIARKHHLTLTRIHQWNPFLETQTQPHDFIAISSKGSAHLLNMLQENYLSTLYKSSHPNLSDMSYQSTASVIKFPNYTNDLYEQTSTDNLKGNNFPRSNKKGLRNNIDRNSKAIADYSTAGVNNKLSERYLDKRPSERPRLSSTSNGYIWGYCTYYAFERREQLGKAIGKFWGNANNWARAARHQGFNVNRRPQVGAVFQTSKGEYGHVGVVEKINKDHSIVVSEMNWNGLFGKVSYRIVANPNQYHYIH
ncbi:CHAP domain-containing protein [Staphylococcus sp. SQ8-PEA]|uniref:CHAP domain-containing protein n=1 Tax=Staphylococcus marylandisciuri TaxID=2981529 RepID=A0ABT2QPE2_9STAP|nr:CHAP domain-containing protein [Staphylococcus marylandisciuri]MCU5745839.1 CHAP domain-containing protein [Staphylococcus marylandisciuri]